MNDFTQMWDNSRIDILIISRITNIHSYQECNTKNFPVSDRPRKGCGIDESESIPFIRVVA